MKTVLYLSAAVALIGGGAFLYMSSNNVSAADRAACEQNVRRIYGDNPDQVDQLIERCNTAGMVAMMDAQVNNLDAETSAQNIAAANRGGLLNILISCAMFGGGVGALGAAFRASRDRRKAIPT